MQLMAGGDVRGNTAPSFDEADQPLRSREDAELLVLEVLRRHADSLLRVARRHSLCADDAQDAYQHALEMFVRHAPRLYAEGAPLWVHTVVKREAQRLRLARVQTVAGEEPDLDAHVARSLPTPDEQIASFELLTRSAEALQRLKPHELRALWLAAQGHSYQEIAELCSWSYTKVNRCITEGRRNFLRRYEGIEAGEECRRWEPVLSAIVDGEADAALLARVRPHLRNCPACRATVRELHETTRRVAALLPVPAIAAAAAHGGHATGGLLSRLYEAIVGPVHERAMSSALKLQAGTDALAGGKVAAVAASAAAIAGGGVAVDQTVLHVSHHRAAPGAAHVRHVGMAAAAASSAAAPPPPAALHSPRPRHASATTATRRHAGAPSAEFGFSHHRSHARAGAASADAAPTGGEFADATATPTASASTSAPPASTASTGSSRAAATAAQEFGG